MNLNEFLRAFFPDENEQIHFRVFKPKDAPDTEHNKPQKLTTTRKKLLEPNGEILLKKMNHLRGIYFAPNTGGHSDADITRFNAAFVENDNLSIEQQIEALDNCPLPTSIRIQTKRSIHAYWLLDGNCAEKEWRELQERLISYFDGDKAIKNPSRVMRLPFFWHLTYKPKTTGSYECQTVELLQFNPERRYSIAKLQATFPPVKKSKNNQLNELGSSEPINKGQRNTTLFSLAGSLRQKGFGENEILATLREVNKTRVKPPLEESELVSIAKSAIRYNPDNNIFEKTEEVEKSETEILSIPVLSDVALYGLAGAIVRTIEPHTEADNAALLLQFLAGFGCLIGKTAYFRAEADFHYTKIFGVLVGASSKGRKGTSFGHIRRLLSRVDETFADCIIDGLSSGEGLISHLRDPQYKKEAIKDKNGKIIDYQDEMVDEGTLEKRAFVVEPEFARVLRVMQREGNTLSSIIRQAWDTDRLKIMTKNPLTASDTHISIFGHITMDELRRNLNETETSNGFANRYLWGFVRRSKYLPEGGNLQESGFNPLVEKLHIATDFARNTNEIKRDDRARQRWIEVYQKLSDGHTGLLGSVTSRAEAQVMRLACLFALLDCSDFIRLEHLEAALALWQYCEDSARYIFGDQTGNKTADAIYEALQNVQDGLTRTQIRDLFQRNATAAQMNSAIKLLIELGRVEIFKEKTNGRPQEIIKARHYDINDKNDKSLK